MNQEYTSRHQNESTDGSSGLIKAVTRTAAALAVGAGLFWGCATTYIHPGQQGIKQVKVGLIGEEGVRPQVYGPGLHVRMPGFETIHKLPSDVLTLNYFRHPTDNKHTTDLQAAQIETSDGFTVTLDATINYRIADPYKVITELGPGELYETSGIIQRGEAALKRILGQLDPQDFFDVDQRVPKQEQTTEFLNTRLEPYGLHVEDVLVRNIIYENAVQQRFENKAVEDQRAFTEDSRSRLAEVNTRLDSLMEAGSQAAELRKREGHQYVTRRNAEADRFVRETKSEADKLVELAEAEKVRLTNAAYSSGQGADLLVGIEMAKALENLDYILMPVGKDGINPLDIDQLSRTLGGN